MYFVEKDQMYDLARSYENRASHAELKEIVEDAGCLAIIFTEVTGKIAEGTAIISTANPDRFIRECILHEFVHDLGMYTHSVVIRPSIMSPRADISDFSVNDRIVLRTLYDERIEPDMRRGKALKVAREIIAELVKEVRAGEPAPAPGRAADGLPPANASAWGGP